MAAIGWSAMPAVPHRPARASERRCPSGRHASRQQWLPKKSQADEFIPYSARCPVGIGEARHSPLKAPQLRAWWRHFHGTLAVAWISSSGSIQSAIGHELCLYRSYAVRQGTVVLLLKISNGVDAESITMLSHSEAFAILLLEVAGCGRQPPSNLGASCKLVARRNIPLTLRPWRAAIVR